MTNQVNSTMPAPGEIRLDRDSLVRLALERMSMETRRGTRSAIDDLPEGVRHSIGILKAQGWKHADIHTETIKALGLEPDDDEAPNYHAINRWLVRYEFVYNLVRAAERSKLVAQIELAKATGDLRDGTIIANQMILQRIMDTMAECPDFRDLNNGQMGNLISALSVATKAGLDDRKLDKAIQLADARIANLTTRTVELQTKIDNQRKAVEAAKAQLEAKAQSGDGKTVDLQSVAAMLDQIMREAA
ncbi:MAG: hypothetical protein IT430_09805 [Phycisphaerales bacterium]|nr:hypothetical protein [Phycisphaerales bacterium]